MPNNWFVVHTMSGQERKVKANLEARVEAEEMGEFISCVLIPTENVSEVKGGKKRISTRLFYPGYILVEMEMSERTWHFVRQTSGILGFLGDREPIPLQEREVQEVLGQIEDKKEKVKPKIMFEVGEAVKVTEGPFVNFGGVINDISPEKGKLHVMVSIFGRSTPLELEYWQVERT